jgi:hypothetical protein
MTLRALVQQAGHRSSVPAAPRRGMHRRLLGFALTVALVGPSACSRADTKGDGEPRADVGFAARHGGSDARSEPTSHCTGVIRSSTVRAVRVPVGRTCALLGTTVLGNVLVEPEGRLIARRVSVAGDVDSRAARWVSITARSIIGGNLVMERGSTAVVGQVRIHGRLVSFGQRGPLAIRFTAVAGDVVVNGNLSRSIVTDSRIGGDFSCRMNRVSPFRANNIVIGERQGQCTAVLHRRAWPWTDDRPARRVSARPPEWHRPPCAGDSVSDDPSDDECDDD